LLSRVIIGYLSRDNFEKKVRVAHGVGCGEVILVHPNMADGVPCGIQQVFLLTKPLIPSWRPQLMTSWDPNDSPKAPL
jgi:hypothetical protein